jgi:hypothetical protein
LVLDFSISYVHLLSLAQRKPDIYSTGKLINLSIADISAPSLIRLATPSLPSLPTVSFESFLSCVHVPTDLADDVPLRLRFKVELLSSYLRVEADRPNGKQGGARTLTQLPGTRRAKPRLKNAANESFVGDSTSAKRSASSIDETYPLPRASLVLELLELPSSPEQPRHVSTSRKQALAKLQLLMTLGALRFHQINKDWADSIRSGAARSSLLKSRHPDAMQELQLCRILVEVWEQEVVSHTF